MKKSDYSFSGLFKEGMENVARKKLSPIEKASDISWVKHYETWFVNGHSERGYKFLSDQSGYQVDGALPWSSYLMFSKYPDDLIKQARLANLVIWNDLPFIERMLWSLRLR